MSGSPIIATELAPSSTIDSRYFLAPVGGTGWLMGIWLASATTLDSLVWFGLTVPLLVAAAWLWRRGRVGLAMAFGAAVALGAGRYALAQPPLEPGHIHYYNGARDVKIAGLVVEEPAVHDTHTQLLVAVREITLDGSPHPVRGTIQVETGRYPIISYGTAVSLVGDVSAPIALGSPGYATYLERHGVLSVMDFPRIDVKAEGGGSAVYRWLLRVKARSRGVIAASLPEPHAALLTGILLGDDSGIPRQLEQDFRETGTTHIIAISGFNIAIIIALLDSLTAPLLPRRTAAVLIMVFIGLYAVLVGASGSVVRASIMGITYLVGRRLLGRPTVAVAGLFTAAFLMTAARPDTLWDVGFQLSFAATLGLMLYAGPWTRRLDRGAGLVFAPQVRGRVVGVVADVLVVTLAAQVLTLPLILFHFGRLSLASLPANFLVLPAQPAVMATGGLTMLLGSALPFVGQVAGWVAWLFLNYTIAVIRLLALMPAASLPLPLSAAGLVATYLLIAIVTLLPALRKEGQSPGVVIQRAPTALVRAVASVAVLALLLLAWNDNRPDGRLRVAFLDVGQGDAIFIQTPTGRQVLVDGGRYPSVTLDELGRQMPFWDRSIDIVIATHPDDDHVAGLVDVMQRYEVSGLITNGAGQEAETTYAELLEVAAERGAAVHAAQVGEVIALDEGVQLEILHAGPVGAGDDRNDASVVGLLTYGRLSVLLTGDAEEAAEAAMLQRGVLHDIVVLKAGHHGANTSSGAPFLAAISPQIVIISAGADNSYGHPAPAMLARAAAVGAAVLRTDDMGTIEVVSDGQRMWWEVERAGD
ncbi:MAG: DNA internalization-related competence protein ComEC/Rec2 [Candidatus Promineofilum sp.]|nr:DNA internalization-related competence protein ComEC/Rec2 [Promineifilum sp.]